MSNKRLNAIITIGGTVSSSLKSALGGTQKQIQQIGQEVQNLTRQQTKLGQSIQVFGRMGKDVDGLRTRYAGVTAELDKMRKAQQRLIDQHKRSEYLKGLSTKLGATGAAMSAGALAIGMPVMGTVNEAKNYQTELARIRALGLGEEVAKDAERFAWGLKTLGTSKLENLTLVKDALSVFGDLHHAEMAAPILAKMKFGSKMFGEGAANNETKFMDMLKVIELRGGTKSQADLEAQANMVQRVISATGGRVGPEEWRHLIATGGLAAKSMRDDAFYYQLEPLVQEMGGDRVGTGLMSAYQNLYQGRGSTRSIRNLDKLGLLSGSLPELQKKGMVELDKAGQIGHINPGALKGADLFRQSQYEWMKQVLLPSLAQKGLTSKDQVLDAIGSIFSSRKGADLMAAMYLQTQNIDKNEKLNKGAADINQNAALYAETAAGKQAIAEKKLEDAKLRMGNAILPMYTRALEVAGDALERLNKFVDENPKLSSVMFTGLGAIAGVLAVGGPLLIGLAALPLAANGFNMLAAGIRLVGSALLLNPIGATITAIAVGAVLLYKYWDPIMEWFGKQIDWLGDKWRAFKAWLGIGSDAPASPTAGRPTPPAAPPLPGAGGSSAAGYASFQNTFNITQLPGENADDLAQRIARKMQDQQRTKSRSMMFDPVTP